MRNVLLISIFSLLIFSNAFGQRGFGGSLPADELLNSISAKASGMGETGVSHVHEKSFYFNPGTLGLFALENKIFVSGFLKKTTYKEYLNFYNCSFSLPLQKSKKRKYYFAVGGYYSVTKSKDSIEITSYEYPEGMGLYFTPSYKNFNTTFSIGYNGKIQFGIGLTYRKIKEFSGLSVNRVNNIFEVNEFFLNKSDFDFGFIARFPVIPDLTSYKNKFYFIPSIGFTVNNFTITEESITDGYIIDVPKRTSLSFSLKSGLVRKIIFNNQREILSVLPTFELYKVRDTDWQKKYGIELGLYQTLFVRIGRIDDESYIDKNTDGFSLNSRGLFNMLQNENSTKNMRTGLNRFFTDLVSLEYTFANSVLLKSYHELIITFQL